MNMTLEEAIAHAEKMAEMELEERSYALEWHDNEEAEKCQKCADEHRQLAVWLRELLERRKQEEQNKPCVLCETLEGEQMNNIVTVRWWDGYMEEFECTEVRFGCDLFWMRLSNGSNRHIPLRQVRWFSTSIESHERRTDE